MGNQGPRAVDAEAKLSKRDVCTKLITPALVAAGRDVQTQIREEVGFTKGRLIVRGRPPRRPQRADRPDHGQRLPPVRPGHAKLSTASKTIERADGSEVELTFA